MKPIIKDNKLVIIAKPKTIHFYLSKDVDKNIKKNIDFIIKHNEFLAEHVIEKNLADYYPNRGMVSIFMNTEKH